MNGFLPELLLIVLLFAQLLLLLPERSATNRSLHAVLFLVGMVAVLAASVLSFQSEEAQIFAGALKVDSLFRLPRACVILAAIMLGRIVSSSRALPERRKPEVLFILSTIAFLARVLLLSQSLLCSYLSLFAMAMALTFLTGLSFHQRNEREATLKWWYQLGLMVTAGAAALFIFLWQAGDLQYAAIKMMFSHQSYWTAYPLVLLFCFPFFALSGLFPLHFIPVDRDHGAPWSTQAIASVLVAGVATLAFLKALVSIRQGSNVGPVPLGVLEGFALVGAFWGALGAYTQRNAKRFLAFFTASQWAIMLLVVNRPSALSLSAAIYYYLALTLSLALVYSTLSFFHERMQNDEMQAAHGAGRQDRWAGVFLLVGLSLFVFSPPFMGFPAFFHLFGALFEQQSIWRVLSLLVLQLVSAFIAVQLLANVFFRDEDPHLQELALSPTTSYSIMDASVGAFLVIALLCGGLFWDVIFAALDAAAKNFII